MSMKWRAPSDGRKARFVVLSACALTALPVACGGDDDDANNADPEMTVETGGTTFGTGGQSPVATSTGLTGGSIGGTMGIAPDPSSGGSPGAGGANPAYEEIPFSRCVPEFCSPVPGAEVCCRSPDGPCGADYGNGCERPRGDNTGTGGFSWGGFGGFGAFGGFGGFGGAAGSGGAADAGARDDDAGTRDGSAGGSTAPGDASADATSD